MLTQEQKQYILDNKEYQTQHELSESLGVSDYTMSIFCKENGIKCVNSRERANKYILNHPHLTVKELAEKLEMAESSVSHYCWLLKHKPPIESTKKKPVKISYSDSIKKATQKAMMHYYLDLMIKRDNELNRSPRFKDKYNQTGSSLTDELNGITTTQRENTLYK